LGIRRGWVKPDEKMYVRADNSEFEDLGPFLSGDAAEKPVKKRGHRRVDERSPVTRCPDDVKIDTMMHDRIW
jgi:hypothetical protein